MNNLEKQTYFPIAILPFMKLQRFLATLTTQNLNDLLPNILPLKKKLPTKQMQMDH